MIRYLFNTNMSFTHSYNFSTISENSSFPNINVFLHFLYKYYFYFNEIIPINIWQRAYISR